MPYHHPAELANRVAMLDHMAQGRLNFGVAASGLPSDWAMFNVDGNAGQHREMTREALDIILKLWTAEEPFDYAGKYWKVTKTEPDAADACGRISGRSRSRYPPIGVAGVSAGSDTLKLAGEHGFLPMSLNLNPTYVASHWESVEEGARRSGRTPSRADWRLVREIFVADTDEEAWRLSVGAQMGRMMREYFLPLLTNVGVIQFLKHDDERRRQRRHPGILRHAQLADRLAGDRRREDRADVRGGRRLRRAPAVLLRLQREPRGLARFDAAARRGGDAQGRAPRPGSRKPRCVQLAARSGLHCPYKRRRRCHAVGSALRRPLNGDTARFRAPAARRHCALRGDEEA